VRNDVRTKLPNFGFGDFDVAREFETFALWAGEVLHNFFDASNGVYQSI
jgi:hypothetical protein